MMNKEHTGATAQIANAITSWLMTGELDIRFLANNFVFQSPYWKQATREEFIGRLVNATDYKETALAKIVKFDPIIVTYSDDQQYFNIYLTYFTKNGLSVNECVLGRIEGEKLSLLISIYDLEETKQALEIE